MIEFQGELQESEFRRAQWVSTPKLFRWLGWIIMAAIVMNLATGGLRPILDDPFPSAIQMAGVVVFALFLIIAPRRAITKAWRNTPLLHERVTGQISEEGVTWKTPTTDSTYGWDKMIKRRVAEDLLLLYTSSSQALILPRSYFGSESDWAAVRALITQKIRAA